MNARTVLDQGKSERPRTSKEYIDHVRKAFIALLSGTVRTAVRQLAFLFFYFYDLFKHFLSTPNFLN